MANGSAAKATPAKKSDGVFSRIAKFVKESYVETVKKSSWPTRTELRQFTIVVILAILVVSVWIGGIDLVLARLTSGLSM